MSETRYTFCHICEECCGLEVSVDKGRVTEIRPDKHNPYNWREFCVKGVRAHESIYHPKRITTPMKRVGDKYVAATYEEAIADIAARLKKIMAEHGPDAIGAYSGNPQSFSFSAPTFLSGFLSALPTHNYYFAGSIDTNALFLAAERMYGSPWLTLNTDVDPCRCFLLIGANPAISGHAWAGHVADGWKRILAAQEKGADLIVVDPRLTPTAAKADLHVAIKPGEDWAFLLGVLKVVFENHWLHAEDCARCKGLDQLRALAAGADLARLSQRCDVDEATIRDVARRFASAEAAQCVTRTGPGLTLDGTLAEWLGQALNVVTGRMERPGGRFFATGLFDLLTAVETMFPPATTPSRVRGLPPIAGAHSIAELPDEIETPGRGQIRAFLIHGGNPVVSGPEGDKLDAALAKLELLVSIDFVQRESHRHAHWLIPAVHFLERTEMHPLMAAFHDAPFVQMGRAAVDPPLGVRHDWEFLADLALAMDVPLFGKPMVNRIIRGSRLLAKLTGITKLAFDPSWFAKSMVRQGGKAKWKDILRHPHGYFYGERSLEGFWKSLRTPDKKVNLFPADFAARLKARLAEAPAAPNAAYPLRLISRRRTENMNSWLTETTGARMKPCNADVVEINREDAASLGIADGQPVKLSSRVASLELRALISDRIRPGVVVAEHGWGSRLFDPQGDSAVERYGANRNRLIANDELDPFTAVPAMNGTQVRVETIASTTAAIAA